MDFEKLINFILNNPKNINIEYSNINGEEKLVINGEEIKEESFDDSKIKEEVKNYKDIVENLDKLPQDSKKKASYMLSNWESLTQSFIQKQLTQINSSDDKGYTCRVHGDFHLGQVMVTKDNDLRFIDFAGEPGLSAEQRKQKHIYVRDYAGMYRSIYGYMGAVAVEEFANMSKNPFMSPHALPDREDRLEILNGEKQLSSDDAKDVINNISYYPPIMHGYISSICGGACDRACYIHLEEKGALNKKFENKFRKRDEWILDVK